MLPFSDAPVRLLPHYRIDLSVWRSHWLVSVPAVIEPLTFSAVHIDQRFDGDEQGYGGHRQAHRRQDDQRGEGRAAARRRPPSDGD